jgi:hypothetical protein
METAQGTFAGVPSAVIPSEVRARPWFSRGFCGRAIGRAPGSTVSRAREISRRRTSFRFPSCQRVNPKRPRTAPSFRAECPALLPLREAPGPGRAPGSTASRAREIRRRRTSFRFPSCRRVNPKSPRRRAVIPSGVSRAFAFARSAGTRSRGISLGCNARLHFT